MNNSNAPFQLQLASYFAGLTLVFVGSLPASALNNSQGSIGSNHKKAHEEPHKATGTGAKFAVIETSDKGNPKGTDRGILPNQNNLGNRLKGEFEFEDKKPGQVPDKITHRNPNNEKPGDRTPTGEIYYPGNNHSTLVADIAAGNDPNFLGVANELTDVFFGSLGKTCYYQGGALNIAPCRTPATPDQGDSIYNSFRTATDWLNREKEVGLFNLSDWILGDGGYDVAQNRLVLGSPLIPNDNGINKASLFIDWFTRTRDVLLVKSAGNNGQANGFASNQQITNPGDAFNVITVGATDADFITRAPFSSYWLKGDDGKAPDVRGKPDILAPGTNIGDGKAYGGNKNSGTSFAAPHVAGAAALLWEKGLNLGKKLINHLPQKAIILNSARKRGINPDENEYRQSFDRNKEASDQNYVGVFDQIVNGKVVPKGTLLSPGTSDTKKWTPTEWKSTDKRVLSVTKPLDDEQGTGLLDAERVLIQFDGGQQNGNVQPIGWDKRDFPVKGSFIDYILDFPIDQGTFVTTSLAWDRIVTELDGDTNDCSKVSTPSCGQVDLLDTYRLDAVPNFDLSIFFKNQLVAESKSEGENVEHLHYPVPEFGNKGDYKIRVTLQDSTTSFPYGLAWWTVPKEVPPRMERDVKEQGHGHLKKSSLGSFNFDGIDQLSFSDIVIDTVLFDGGIPSVNDPLEGANFLLGNTSLLGASPDGQGWFVDDINYQIVVDGIPVLTADVFDPFLYLGGGAHPEYDSELQGVLSNVVINNVINSPYLTALEADINAGKPRLLSVFSNIVSKTNNLTTPGSSESIIWDDGKKVPEPSSIFGLLAFAGLGLMGLRKKH